MCARFAAFVTVQWKTRKDWVVNSLNYCRNSADFSLMSVPLN